MSVDTDVPRPAPLVVMRGHAGPIITILAVLTFWSLLTAFMLTRNDLVAFAIPVAALVAGEGCRRFAKPVYAGVTRALAANSGLALGLSILGLLVLPSALVSNVYWVHVLTIVFIYAIAAQGLNVHLGEIGAINVGYGGFFAIGAYVSAIATADYGAPFFMSLIYASSACWLTGLLIGACTIKTTGDYLSLVTLGFGLIVYQLAVNLTWLTHGTDGIHLPPVNILGHSFKTGIDIGYIHLPKEANAYYLALGVLGLCTLVCYRMTNSWIGRTWAAMRQDPLGAGCFGINVPLLRVLSFGFGSLFAGVAGALYANEIGFIEPGEFTVLLSITLICMVILGGMGNWWGIICGAFIMIALPEKLRQFQELRYLLYGVALLAILIYRPTGLFANPKRRFEKLLG